jgi:ATP-dependent Clp protease protease subunit
MKVMIPTMRPMMSNRGKPVAKKGQEAEIYIYDQIGLGFFGDGVDPSALVSEIDGISADTLHVRINSPGGSVFDGYAIYNAIKRFKGQVTVHVDGLAASIASVIAMAGDEIRMGEGSFFMIHDPWTMAFGTAEEFRKTADSLEKIRESILGTYERRADLSREEISRMMQEESWMDAAEAVEMGFADGLEDAPEVRNAMEFELVAQFKQVPAALQQKQDSPLPTERELERVLRRDAGLSNSVAREIIKHGYKPLKDMRDDDSEDFDGLMASLQSAAETLNPNKVDNNA